MILGLGEVDMTGGCLGSTRCTFRCMIDAEFAFSPFLLFFSLDNNGVGNFYLTERGLQRA